MNREDHVVTLISRWLAGHIADGELCAGLQTDGLSEEQAQAVDELAQELERPDPRAGQLQMVARETLQALAMG